MKVAKIVFSPTGGTERAADILAAALGEVTINVDLTRADCACEIKDCGIAVIAVSSFGGRVPALAAERLSLIKASGVKCVTVCVYGNRAYEDTLVELNDLAEACGFKVIAAVSAVAEHSIIHKYAAGRPDKADEEELRGFAAKILKKAESGSEDSPVVPGNRPYKKAGGGGLVPKAGKTCTACGQCAKDCPAGAIDPSDPHKTDGKKCISCMRCVVKCPQKARAVNAAMVSVAALALKKACSERKSGELFI